jgi:hypothetical protein
MMKHLARLLTSTKALVRFISETRNLTITRTSLINRFNYSDAFVVPTQGQSGGLWLLWNHEVDVIVVDYSLHYIFALCTNCSSLKQYALVRTTSHNIMHVNEKLGPARADIRHINAFCAHVKECGFIDLGYSGPAYTWTNKRLSTNPTYERLDHCLGNAEWCVTFPSTTIYHLLMLCSDHAPILAVLHSTRCKANRPFYFENWWLREQDYNTIAKQSQRCSASRSFTQKTTYLAQDLHKWRKSKPRIPDQLASIKNQHLQPQANPPNTQNLSL